MLATKELTWQAPLESLRRHRGPVRRELPGHARKLWIDRPATGNPTSLVNLLPPINLSPIPLVNFDLTLQAASQATVAAGLNTTVVA